MQTRMKWTLVVATAVFAAACGDSSSFNPTAPSALSPDTSHVVSSAADVEAGSMGNAPKPGNANGNGNGNQPRTPAPSSSETPGGKVEFEGLIDAVSNGAVTVNSQQMLVTANTAVRHGDQSMAPSALKRGDRVHVRANRIPPTS